jgi:hypothetical protein
MRIPKIGSLALALLLAACDDARVGSFPEAGSQDGGSADVARAVDMTPMDARVGDASPGDAARIDAGQTDAQAPDARVRDAAFDAAPDMANPDGAAGDGAPSLDARPDPCEVGQVRPCREGCGVQQACADGVWQPCELPVETCNGEDDDCDGRSDETFAGLGQPCSAGVGPCQREGTAVCNGAGDDVVCDAVPGGGEAESCNGQDDDCDGETDEDIPTVDCYDGPPGTLGIGICRGAMRACVGGNLEPCNQVLPRDEDCDPDGGGNQLDDDCDGNVDEGCVCEDGDRQDCGTDVGECNPGEQVCENNAYGPCLGAVGPQAEICDGLDNNCDGRPDEGVLNACGRCGPVPDEVCNDVDDDCDGQTDEGFGLGQPCFEGVGACRREGVVNCPGPGGDVCSAIPGDPIAELCNAQDDDCDGRIDEQISRACGQDVGNCEPGIEVCANGQFGACVDAVGPEAEVCNEEDDDCDGSVDEGTLNACGECGAVPQEQCNGLDDDCDGAQDEGVGNACGGCAVLAAGPGEACGACGRGTWVCDALRESVLCENAEVCHAVQVAVAYSHSCARLEDGSVYCWGSNGDGQRGEGVPRNARTGTPSLLTEVPAIDLATMTSMSCIINEQGHNQCWGGGGNPPFRGNSVIDQELDALRGGASGGLCGLRLNIPEVRCQAGGPLGDQPIGGAIDAAIESGGSGFGCILNIAGDVLCQGDNSFGQLGDGTTTNRNQRVLVRNLPRGATRIWAGGNHACAEVNDETWCWGRNYPSAALGQGPERFVDPVRIGAYEDISIIGGRGCRLAMGRLECIGDNRYGQVGVGRATAANVLDWTPIMEDVTQVALSNDHACALDADGRVWCWGYNTGGPIGDGTQAGNLDRPTPVQELSGISDVVLQSDRFCVRRADATWWCWGRTIGDGTEDTHLVPLHIEALDGAIQVGLTSDGGCARWPGGAVRCWGTNSENVGAGLAGPSLSPVPIQNVADASLLAVGEGRSCVVRADRTLWCWGEQPDVGNIPQQIAGLAGVTEVAAGDNSICLRDAVGLFCIGGQYPGRRVNGPLGLFATGNGYCFVQPDGVLECWNTQYGGARFAQFRNIRAIRMNNTTTCVLDDDLVYCWPSISRNGPGLEPFSRGALALFSGRGISCQLVEGGVPQCWGDNQQGLLDGTAFRASPTLVRWPGRGPAPPQ